MSPHHPFGELLTELRGRKPGLTQTRLAELAGYDPAILVRMCHGKKDLTGPSGRERIVRIIGALCDEGVRLTVDEANALLASADLPPLFGGLSSEAALIRRLHGTVASVTPQRTNLLPALTSFIGREAEIANLTKRLTKARLITLTGAGGVGKTRLAMELASQLTHSELARRYFSDGVWWVELASLTNPALLSQAVADALKLPETPGGAPLAALVKYLEARQMLLILDNCEHLINACAEFVEHLLRHCSKLCVLTTSRETLRVPGEVTHRVPSLKTPDPTHANGERVLDYESVRLFVARASASASEAESGLELTPGNAAAVAQICRQLDGIPLAIELAAALTRTLSVGEIATRLRDRFSLLTSGYRTAVPRHQTLRSAIDWSYDLLSPTERRLLASLSVFVGGWTSEAAESICADEPMDILPVLDQLAQKSLVATEQRTTHIHYRCLETIREYASDKLREMSDWEQDTLNRRYVDYYARLAERSWPRLLAERNDWLSRLEFERGNFLAAIDLALRDGFIIAAQRLVAALGEFWRMRSHWREGHEQLQKVLARSDPTERTSLRAGMLIFAGVMEMMQLGDSHSFLEEALQIATELDDKSNMARALVRLGNEAWGKRDFIGERAYYEQALVVGQEMNDPTYVAGIVELLADNSLETNQLDLAQRYYEESMRMWTDLGMYTGWSLRGFGQIALLQGDYDKALALFKEGLRRTLESGYNMPIPILLSRFAGVALARGDTVRAARYFGAEDGLLEAQGAILKTPGDAAEDRERAAVRAALDETAFAAAWAEGHAMTLEDVVEYALSEG